MNHDDNSVPGDHTIYSYEMGSQGITLQLKAAGRDYDVRPNHSIFWPYENFAKVLKGSSEVTPNAKDKSVPKASNSIQETTAATRIAEASPMQATSLNSTTAGPMTDDKFYTLSVWHPKSNTREKGPRWGRESSLPRVPSSLAM